MIRVFVPVILSLVLVAAHLLRAGNVLSAGAALLAIALLFVRRAWAVQLLQVILGLATIEWVRALVGLTRQRMQMGEPWVRLVVILGAVAVLTALSLAALFTRRASEHYRMRRRAS